MSDCKDGRGTTGTLEIVSNNMTGNGDLDPERIIEDLSKIKHHSETNASLLRRLINEHYSYEKQLRTGKKIRQVTESDILKLRSFSPSYRSIIFIDILNLLEAYLKANSNTTIE